MSDYGSFERSFLKWAGSKYTILPRILDLLPIKFGRFLEPFTGSCVVSENIKLKFPKIDIFAGDSNNHLIDLYKRIILNPTMFIDRLIVLFHDGNSESRYYMLRDQFNNGVSDVNLLALGVTKSELFVYLNKHCFNGLCRFNKVGKFNVPFGRYDSPDVPEKELLLFSNLMSTTNFFNGDYTSFLNIYNPGIGDVLYMDPPYVPLSVTSSFTDYSNDGGFSLDRQKEISSLALKYCAQGAYVIVSNHDTLFTRSLYASAKITSFEARRSIGGKSDSRKYAPELLAVFLPS